MTKTKNTRINNDDLFILNNDDPVFNIDPAVEYWGALSYQAQISDAFEGWSE